MKTYDIIMLIETHGDMKLSELVKMMLGDRLYTCPECKGKGVFRKAHNSYPSGLPDSGWVFDEKYMYYRDENCTLCEGHGYTVKEFVPKMIQQGWTTK